MKNGEQQDADDDFVLEAGIGQRARDQRGENDEVAEQQVDQQWRVADELEEGAAGPADNRQRGALAEQEQQAEDDAAGQRGERDAERHQPAVAQRLAVIPGLGPIGLVVELAENQSA